jgi:putative ABC transport system permease protein
LIALTLLTGFLAGLYPAFYLSSFKPVAVLKGKLRNTISAGTTRKGLVVFQFTISIVLILAATLISNQMTFLRSQSLGFAKTQKVILPIQTSESNKNASTLKTELLANSMVISAAHASTYPGIENVYDMLFYAVGKTINETVDIISTHVGEDYIETLGIELLQGRGFSNAFTNDTSALVLNEAAVKELGYSVMNAVGRSIYFDYQGKTFPMNIIGVVKDYHFQSLHQKIKPMALSIAPLFSSPNSYLIINVKTDDYANLLVRFEKIWSKINPDSPFGYSFLDKDFQKNYEKEDRTLSLIRYFTLIAIVIACLGLFGLTRFSTEQRVKEIGVRKVLGASVLQIVTLLSKDYIKLVLLSIIIASPIGYYVVNEWLQAFAYHIDISGWVFAAVGLAAILMAIITVSFQAISSALANPVTSLRSE